ncbi:MAG: protein kinase [Gemmatimonadota bacterium]
MSAVPTALAAALADRYTIERELGAGGMATVYLAHDRKHDRKVAIKVLRPELAAVIGAERFLAEIKTTANLQHPHILPLFDSGAVGQGEGDGRSFLYYVMPFIEGESLRDRLTRETQLSIGDSVRIASEVAAALDYAHRRGVIHRDIKPENILLHEGQALVADFGIALAASKAGGTRMTETGMSLGTPHYMSPEQAMGEREITARSDIYALGAVLYEMLVGEPPFTGPTAQAIVAKVVTESPRPLVPKRHTIPPHIEAATLTALEKTPADRFASAAEFAQALTNTGFVHTSRLVTSRVDGSLVSSLHESRKHRGTLILGVFLIVTTALATWALTRSPGTPPAAMRQWNIVLPDSAPLDFFGLSVYGEGQPALAISRDGSRLAYVARARGTSLLYLRRLDESISHPLAGTEGASQPFFSPDGEWVGFFAAGQLKKVALAGGAPIALADVRSTRGAAWTSDGRILLSDPDVILGQMYWVPASGGTPTPLGRCASNVYWPSLLPGEEWVIGSSADRRLILCSLKEDRTLVLGVDGPMPVDSAAGNLIRGSYPRYAASGHLVYLVGNTLTALPFDSRHLKVLGPPAPIEQAVRRESWDAAGQYALADDGTLVFAPGVDAAKGVMVWVDRAGRITDTLPLPPGDYFNIFVSPSGKRISFASYLSSGQAALSIFDVERGLANDFPLKGGVRFVSWWPEHDDAIVYLGAGPGSFGSAMRTQTGISWRMPVDGGGARDSLLGSGDLINTVTRDLNYYGVRRYGDSASVWLVTADGKRRQLLTQDGGWPAFSPDGRWITFASPAGLRISPVPSDGRSQVVSPASADEPEWSPDGREIYYRDGTRWMSMSVDTRGSLTVGKPRLLFQGRYLNVRAKSYDVGPDGRFLLLLGPPEETIGQLNIITGLFSEMRRLAPASRKP